ncbi:uncharacterized protein BJ171DRAFT_518331, partial [Polychytrium aggregatum]|uniref:uncharacterized protein n=1 Tax=Polychytrium aggregatum TaxID=110093 RepID=UPI0022FEA090
AEAVWRGVPAGRHSGFRTRRLSTPSVVVVSPVAPVGLPLAWLVSQPAVGWPANPAARLHRLSAPFRRSDSLTRRFPRHSVCIQPSRFRWMRSALWTMSNWAQKAAATKCLGGMGMCSFTRRTTQRPIPVWILYAHMFHTSIRPVCPRVLPSKTAKSTALPPIFKNIGSPPNDLVSKEQPQRALLGDPHHGRRIRSTIAYSHPIGWGHYVTSVFAGA